MVTAFGCSSSDASPGAPPVDHDNPTAGNGGSGAVGGEAGVTGGAGGAGGSGSGGTGGDAGGDAVVAVLSKRHIALERDVVCWIDSSGELTCEAPDGRTQVVPGEFVEIGRDGYGFIGLRTDGSALLFEVAQPGSSMVVQDCSDGAAGCVEQRPSRGKFVSVAVDGITGCGALDDGTVECWGPAAPTTLPDEPLVQIEWRSLEGLCGITAAGKARCWLESGSELPSGISNDAAQLRIVGDRVFALSRTGIVTEHSTWPMASVATLELPPIRMFDVDSEVYGITLDGDVVSTRRTTSRVDPPAGPFVEVTASTRDACALREDGSHACWGFTWGRGGDTERCTEGNGQLSGTVAGESVDYDDRRLFSDSYLVNDHTWRMSVGNYDLFLLRSAEPIVLNETLDLSNASLAIDGSAFLISKDGVAPRVYCAGSGSTAMQVDDEVVLHLENVTALATCGEMPVEGEWQTCEEGCTATSSFEGQVVETRVVSDAYIGFGDLQDRVVVYENGMIVRAAEGPTAYYSFIFTPPDGPNAGAIYCAGNAGIGPDGEPTDAALSKVGNCQGSTSSDTLEGCLRY